jgi:DNA repair exonuclease SbcCD ATPase subunit
VASDLATGDAGFRRDGEQLKALDVCLSRLDESRASLAKLVATAARIGEINKQLQALPEQMRQAREAMARAESERTAADQSRVNRSQPIPGLESRLVEAQRSAAQARQALAGLQSAYDRSRAQQTSPPELAVAVEMDTGAVIEQQYHVAKGLADQAETAVRAAQAALDAARRDLTQAETAVREAADRVTLEHRRLSEAESKGSQMRSELSNLETRGQYEFTASAAALAAYLPLDGAQAGPPSFRPDELAAGSFGWLGPTGLDRDFAFALLQPGPDPFRRSQATAVLGRLGQWLETRRRSLDQERVQIRQRRDALWRENCRRLLGETLAEAACREGLRVG